MKYLVFIFLFLTSLFAEQNHTEQISFFVSKKDDTFLVSIDDHASMKSFDNHSRSFFSFFSFVFDFVTEFVGSSLSRLSNHTPDPLEKSMLNFFSGIIGDVFQRIKGMFFSRNVFGTGNRELEVSVNLGDLCHETSVKNISKFKVKIDSNGDGCDGNNSFFSEEQAKAVIGEFVNYLTQESQQADFFELRKQLDLQK